MKKIILIAYYNLSMFFVKILAFILGKCTKHLFSALGFKEDMLRMNYHLDKCMEHLNYSSDNENDDTNNLISDIDYKNYNYTAQNKIADDLLKKRNASLKAIIDGNKKGVFVKIIQ